MGPVTGKIKTVEKGGKVKSLFKPSEVKKPLELFTTQSRLLTTLRKKPFVNSVGKEKC